jgi:hypothetical protein
MTSLTLAMSPSNAILDGGALAQQMHQGRTPDPRSFLAEFGYAPPPLDRVDRGKPLAAEVNHGIWIWICPCKLGSLDEPPVGGGVAWLKYGLGWCPRCENADVGGNWRLVDLPVNYREIERVLALRPEAENQNWWPGETVDDLVRENVENGLPGQDAA